MKLLIITVQDALATIYGGDGESERDQETQFLELKLATDNPKVKENLEYWKRLVQERNYYGLLVCIDHDKNEVQYLPIETKQQYDEYTKEK
jgi:hypothetical protein